MANKINLNAEIGADYIGDDAQPAVAFSNTGSGPGLEVHGLVLQSTVSLDVIDAESADIDALTLGSPILAAAATITNLNVQGASRASGAVLALTGDAFVSATSIDFGDTAAVAGHGAIRVVLTDGTFGWIPVIPDARIDGAVVA